VSFRNHKIIKKKKVFYFFLLVVGRIALLGGRSMILRSYGPLMNENPDGSNSIKVRIFKA